MKGIYWTEGDVATIKSMWVEGRTRGEIAKAVNRTPKAVSNKGILLGLEARHMRRRRTPELIAQVASMRDDKGMRWTEIGKILGIDSSTAYQWYTCGDHRHEVDRNEYQARRDAERLLKLVPPDTRTLTGRLCGDPLPGRDALSMRQA